MIYIYIYIFIYFSSCIFIVGLKVSAWAPTKRTNINLRHLSTCLICGQFVYNYHFIAIIFSSCHISILLSRLDLSFKSNLIVFSKKKKNNNNNLMVLFKKSNWYGKFLNLLKINVFFASTSCLALAYTHSFHF